MTNWSFRFPFEINNQRLLLRVEVRNYTRKTSGIGNINLLRSKLNSDDYVGLAGDRTFFWKHLKCASVQFKIILLTNFEFVRHEDVAFIPNGKLIRSDSEHQGGFELDGFNLTFISAIVGNSFKL